jgi:hypothetical protein
MEVMQYLGQVAAEDEAAPYKTTTKAFALDRIEVVRLAVGLAVSAIGRASRGLISIKPRAC